MKSPDRDAADEGLLPRLKERLEAWQNQGGAAGVDLWECLIGNIDTIIDDLSELATLRRRAELMEPIVAAARSVDAAVAVTADHLKWFPALSAIHYALIAYTDVSPLPPGRNEG